MLVRALPLVAGLCLIGGVAACGETDHKLKVTGLEPEKGDIEGGTYVVIKGNRFMKDGPRNAKIYFGSRQGTVVRFQSDSELIVQAPGGKPDEVVDVLIIFDPGGQLKIPNGFKFVDKADTGLNPQDLGTKKDK
ncbi:MAG: IPT/TIG domain-containing protein [Deltaproteobacteria bacterium]|nr:IPT/TIG domain-containing protein [Deltaproteobacteria bacterium]MDQ3300898.1 IPT/TIG domain-containing protein [Myxococcota bacterium]